MMVYAIPADVACVDDEDNRMTWTLRSSVAKVRGLTAVGSIIWRACEGAENDEAVIAALVKTHGWQDEVIRPYVQDFIGELVGMALLEETS